MKNEGITRIVLIAATTALFLFSPAAPVTAQTQDPLPNVFLKADDLGPRSIEDLTSKVVPRDYAFAWQTMAQALEQNRVDLLDGYFTGAAKQNLSQLIVDQKKNDVRIRYQDHGHKLRAVFYSPAGDAMQLRDHADLQIDILDGQKVINSEQISLQYIVLMTPGADRWLVRDLEVVPEAKP